MILNKLKERENKKAPAGAEAVILNKNDLEDIVTNFNFAKQDLEEKIEKLEQLLNDNNIRKIEETYSALSKINEIMNKIKEIEQEVRTSKVIIRNAEETTKENMFNNLQKFEKILDDFYSRVDKNLEEMLNEKLKNIAEKRIKVYEQNTVQIFNKFYNILKNQKEEFREELKNIKNLREKIKDEIKELKDEIEYIKKDLREVRFSKLNKIFLIIISILFIYNTYTNFNINNNIDKLKRGEIFLSKQINAVGEGLNKLAKMINSN